MHTRKVRAVFDINPVPLGRARVVTTPRGHSRTFMPDTSTAFRDELRALWQYQRIARDRLEGDLTVTWWFWRRCRSIMQRGDVSNLVKAVEDAANPDRNGWRGLWHDDRQIRMSLGIMVAWGPHVRGRIAMHIAPFAPENVPSYDSDGNDGDDQIARNFSVTFLAKS